VIRVAVDDRQQLPRGGRPDPPRGRPAPRALAVVAVLAVGAWIAVGARADGDPASDTLLQQNVSFSYQVPTPAAETALQHAVDDVYAHGGRIKVALIDDPTDLGSIPSLFGRPPDYAHFLGIELGLWYVGPLLVVMPAGFGVYDGGRSTAAAEDALRSLDVNTAAPDDLAQSATDAVQRLAAAGVLDPPDVKAPLVTTHPAVGRRGKLTTLSFDVFDDSGRSNAVVRVYENRVPLATIATPMRFAIGTRTMQVRWRIPAKLRSRRLHYCVVAADPAGNRSAPACALFLRVS
jgi:hypothetical protein